MIRQHNLTHCPPRPWCPVCVMARGKEDAHRRGANKVDEEDKGAIPTVSMDYYEPEGKGQDKIKGIVGKDETTGVIFHHRVACKGVGDEWATKRIVKDLEDMGRRDVVIKTDGEPAIVSVQTKVQALREGRTLLKNPPSYNPESNGPCEKAVQDAAAQTRALKIGLESRLKAKLDGNLPVMEWIMEHAAFVLNKFSVGHDGMTSHERLTGQKWRRPLVEFGEVVYAKMTTKKKEKGKTKQQQMKFAPRSIRAVWVGVVHRTGEHIVIKVNGDAVRCRTIKRVPEEERWDIDAVMNIKGTPRRPTPSSAGSPEVLASRLADEEAGVEHVIRPPRAQGPRESGVGQAEARSQEIDIRDLRITDAILEKYGGPEKYTPGCPGCEHKKHGRDGHRGHTQACRQRLYEAMADDEDGKAKLEEMSNKLKSKHPTVPTSAGAAQAASQPPDDEPNTGCATPRFGGSDVEMEDDEIPQAFEEDDDSCFDDLFQQDDVDIEDGITDEEQESRASKREAEQDDGRAKRQKVQLLTNRKVVKLTTLAGKTMAGEDDEDEPSPKSKVEPEECKVVQCLRRIQAVKELKTMRDIITKLDKDFRKPKDKFKAQTMNANGDNDVSEVYSPPRIAEMAKQFGIAAGFSLDLTQVDPHDGQPWDFSIPEKRRRALKMVEESRPFMLILCPMCGPFSTLQSFGFGKLSEDEQLRRMADAMIHIKFAVELCLKQYAGGRLFLFEHPAGASSWNSEALKLLVNLEGAFKVNFDFCALDMMVGDKPGGEKKYPVKKRTSIVTNSHAIATVLREAQCPGDHDHAHALNGKASECQEYTPKFCRLICEGIKRELDTIEWRNRMCSSYNITKPFAQLMKLQEELEDLATVPEEDAFTHLYDGAEFYDDISGAPLDKEKAVQARKLEIDYFKTMQVYSKVKREPWMKIISTKWLDVNKGDEAAPNYRARLVGREIKKDKREDLFAATPPLESLRMILSICASNQYNLDPEERYMVMSNDVKRAYFYAPATRPVYIIIPAEDHEPGDHDKVGKLNLSLYGTRDAAMNWAAKFTEFLNGIGFETGAASPCNFYNADRQISVTVHGDDFTSTGRERDLNWLKNCMQGEFEIKTEMLGPKEHHLKQVRILNRVISWQADGIVYEADQRHAEIIVNELELQNAKAVTSPGCREDAMAAGPPNIIDPDELWQDEEVKEAELLPKTEATRYRALAARINYLAQDRPDLLYSAKEISRRMATPCQGDLRLLKRLGRYLIGAPRAIQNFLWQDKPRQLDTYVDSDWAGCKASCRSTSGGAVFHGWHVIKAWATTQATVAMSSAEAELYSLTKGASTTLGLMALSGDMGHELNATVHSDASAAVSIVRRQGLGKLRHIKVQYLWVQERVRRHDFNVAKVDGKVNPADLMTKYLSAGEITYHMCTLGFESSATRAELAPKLSRVQVPYESHGTGDIWNAQTGNVSVTRCHRKPRFELFTPLRVAAAPPARTLTAMRVTEGVFCKTGIPFRRCDNWSSRAGAHAHMGKLWTGTTTFFFKSDGTT